MGLFHFLPGGENGMEARQATDMRGEAAAWLSLVPLQSWRACPLVLMLRRTKESLSRKVSGTKDSCPGHRDTMQPLAVSSGCSECREGRTKHVGE